MWGATFVQVDAVILDGISIHAPRVGRDAIVNGILTNLDDFNPRAPCGARRIAGHDQCVDVAFQSTRPVWGATMNGALDYAADMISIHAPRVGRDRKIR